MNKSSSKLHLIVFLFLFFSAHTQVALANGKVVKEGIERIVRNGADDASKIATRKLAIETAEKSATRQVEKIAAARTSKSTEPVIQSIKQSVKPTSPAPKTLNGSSSQQINNLATSQQNVVRPQKTVDIRTIRPRTPNNQLDNLATDRDIQNTALPSHTQHSLNQKMNRQVKSSDELLAIKKPLDARPVKFDNLGRPSQRNIGVKAEVVVNPKTMRISVNSIRRFGVIRSLFHLLFRPCQFYLK